MAQARAARAQQAYFAVALGIVAACVRAFHLLPWRLHPLHPRFLRVGPDALDGHSLTGAGFGVTDTITPLVDLWLDEGRLSGLRRHDA